MPQKQQSEIFRQLKAPRAAAFAGILFAVLFTSSVVLIRLAVPADPTDEGEWIEAGAGMVSQALHLLPLSGVAFLWFMGVIRDRIGAWEDKFLSSVFFGSGLLFLALTFVSGALAGAVLSIHAQESDALIDSGMYKFGRAATYQITNIYAVKMAGVFMVSLGTIWIRTRLMPRWLAFLTYALALGLLLSIGSNLWVTLIFPAWVCAVSIHILVYRTNRTRQYVTGNGTSR